MEIIEIKTLIDITQTKISRLNQGTQIQIDQQKNFITLSQCIELRSIIHYDDSPKVEKVDIKHFGFGTEYKGKHNVWSFRFNPDRLGVYIDDKGNDLGLLINDLHEVPIIKNLLETINIDKAVFDLKDSRYKNTIIMASQGTI